MTDSSDYVKSYMEKNKGKLCQLIVVEEGRTIFTSKIGNIEEVIGVVSDLLGTIVNEANHVDRYMIEDEFGNLNFLSLARISINHMQIRVISGNSAKH